MRRVPKSTRTGWCLNLGNPLREYFLKNPGHLMDKWDHYFEIYDQHLSRFRGESFTMLEIGVFHGGSLEMWRSYFGKRVRIVGFDIDGRTRELAAPPQISIEIGDQSDREDLRSLADKYGPFDVIIDDGGHTMEQQLTSFEVLWPTVKNGGLYIAEDLHTSYWSEFGGGHLNDGTFIEFAKTLVDDMNAWHARPDDGLRVSDMTLSLRAMHVYDSVIVFEKDVVEPPLSGKTGRPQFPLLYSQ